MRKGSAATEKDDGFRTFVYFVFSTVVLAAGGVIWNLVASNAALDKRVTVLEVTCRSPMPLLPQQGH